MGPLKQTTVVPIEDSSQIAVARRCVRDAAQCVGLDETRVSQAEVVTVELATNLLNHAGRGQILINEFAEDCLVELLSIDKGRGMADVNVVLVDGVSTGSTPGLGLGAIQRLSSSMNVYSWPDKGTVLAIQIGPEPAGSACPGVICTALEHEPASGDRWAYAHREDKDLYLLADGLGHGLLAASASEMAVEIFRKATSVSPSALIEQAHTPMRSTRGAAMAIAAVDRRRGQLTFAGIGNISASIHSPAGTSVSLVSHNGTVGHQMRRVQSFDYTWTNGSLLIMHTDGIGTRWKLGDYPGLAQAAPSVIAGALYRDFRRERDDSTVMVTRLG